jgi:hypothetical protein
LLIFSDRFLDFAKEEKGQANLTLWFSRQAQGNMGKNCRVCVLAIIEQYENM